MHIRPLTPFSIRGTGSITMHIALSIARFFVLAITLAVCASGSNSRFTTSAPLLPHVSRIFHFRPSGPGALCSQWQKCDLKSSCAFFHGGPHYGIGVCKRVVGPGYPCGNPYFQCAPGTKCVKWKGGKRCRILLSADGVCADFSKTLCKYGLECHKGKCLHAGAYGAQCDGKHHLCRSGFICAGSGEVKTCKVLVSKGASCESAAAACEVGTACTKYHEHGLRCVAVVDHGETCGQFKACKYGLKCIDGKCVAAGLKGAKCGFGKHFCFPGLTCVQHGNHKVCEKLMKKGEDCSGQHMSCYPGLKCVGTESDKKCLPPLGKGEFCSTHKHSHRYCASGLTCFKHGSASVCYAVMAPNANCDGKFMACTIGHKCVGPEGHKKCRGGLGKGSLCHGEYNYCADGLSCIGKGTHAKCTGVMGVYGDCSKPFMVCKTGLHCVGPSPTEKRCTALGTKGSKCDGKFHLCSPGLRCYHKKCIKFSGRGGECNTTPFTKCYPGHKCIGSRCYRPVPKGFYCRNPRLPFVVCQAGVHCVGSGAAARCVGLMDEGSSCEGEHMHCKKGLHCSGSAGNRKCKSTAPKGGICGGAHGHCDKGLACVGSKDSQEMS